MKDFERVSSFSNTSASQRVNEGLKSYMVFVYRNMSIALCISGLVAFLFSLSPALIKIIYGTPLGMIIMLAPVGIAFYFGSKIHSMSFNSAKLLFWVFSVVIGASLSYVFLVYTGESIIRAFFIASSIFLALSIYGQTTKTDLEPVRSFLVMGLVGIIIASLVNIFLKSSAMGFVISFISVFIFSGLAAYDTQKIKNMYYMLEGSNADAETAKKVAIMGSLSLYMDFINLFLSILHFLNSLRKG